MNKQNGLVKSATIFVFIMGIVSMFSDMAHEGARSIYGAYLSLLGTSAATIGFVTGLGEMVGYSFRLITGYFADKFKKYWTMTFIGYVINMAAIPALAFVSPNGWIAACFLIVFERVGKAIRQPSKNTLVSFASKQLGAGKAFAIQEFLDQIGAFTGPVLLFLVLLLKRGQSDFAAYSLCFAALAIPAAMTLLSLYIAKRKFPNPENFEVASDTQSQGIEANTSFLLYMIGIGLLALGFADFPLITMHIARESLVPGDALPLLYAIAMFVDAFAALFFGWLFDKKGIKVLIVSSLLSAFFSVFVFLFRSLPFAIVGIALWGVGMGAQESILKSVVATIVPKQSRSTGFGIFETSFGILWFLGSWLMGALYDSKPVLLVAFSVCSQLAAIPFFYLTSKKSRGIL